VLDGQVGTVVGDERGDASSHDDRTRIGRPDRQDDARVGADRGLGHVVECILGGPCKADRTIAAESPDFASRDSRRMAE
jgi:hypothetical protein